MSHAAEQGDGGPPTSLPTVGQGIKVNHEVLGDVCRQLAKELSDLEAGGSGSPKHMQQTSHILALTGNQLGHFPAAEGQHGGDGFAGSCANAQQQINSTYQEFLSAFDDLLKALKKSADNHAQAEQASTDAVNRAYPGSSSKSGAQYYG
jgi:hypothetical protein